MNYRITRQLLISFALSMAMFIGVSHAQGKYQIQDNNLHTPLDGYIARPEPDFKWSVAKEVENFTILDMDSQRWQGEVWYHQLIIVPPAENKYPDTALLLINSGNMTDLIPVMQLVANLSGATVVALNGIPNQPRWGRKEDALIAYTFQQWFQSKDDTWPLLLPMTKSAVKAMDSVQAFSTQNTAHSITKFVAIGGSKRGWTTWLTAAEDKRVVGIIPIVYNMLNLSKQLPHQLDVFGDYSQMISDFVEINLPESLKTPRGKMLSEMVDPWAYRKRITIPKLIINSTNDPYFAMDAEKYYRDDLMGTSNFYFAPNAGHGSGMNVQTLLGSVIGWFHWLESGKDFPTLFLSHDTNSTFQLTTSVPAKAVKLWVAHSTTKDFRPAKWNSVQMQLEGDRWRGTISSAPANGKYTAAIGEAEYAAPGTFLPMKLSSKLEIMDAIE